MDSIIAITDNGYTAELRYKALKQKLADQGLLVESNDEYRSLCTHNMYKGFGMITRVENHMTQHTRIIM